jgi:ribosomal protein S18 acetylase RimI-like enzyme
MLRQSTAMTSAPLSTQLNVRPFQYRDLDDVEQLLLAQEGEIAKREEQPSNLIQQVRQWYGVVKVLSWVPNPLRHLFSAYVAEHNGQICGMIQVSPFNRSRSTWRVEKVVMQGGVTESGEQLLALDVGSQLLRHCFETIWEARTWLIEVDVNDADTLALYRHNGFQPLAQMTYWAIAPEVTATLAERSPDLPNLLPVGNADAFLLHQLDTVSMPPLVRQVFDRQTQDFKTGLVSSLFEGGKHWVNRSECKTGYVFEPQRKAAIGFFRLHLSRNAQAIPEADLTVHPAYTWLYPELLAHMARLVQDSSVPALRLASADYQSEREEYLAKIGAERTEHTLLMSRSVWHKLREAKPTALENLQLSEVLQGLQPARKPIPSRFSLLDSAQDALQKTRKSSSPRPPSGGHPATNPALGSSLDWETDASTPDSSDSSKR